MAGAQGSHGLNCLMTWRGALQGQPSAGRPSNQSIYRYRYSSQLHFCGVNYGQALKQVRVYGSTLNNLLHRRDPFVSESNAERLRGRDRALRDHVCV